MNHDTDVVVVGLGVHGSAAAYELALRGLDVIGLEQFPPGHVRGSSHGATRMTRRAYPGPEWAELVGRAYQGWARWASAAGDAFIRPTGGMYARPDRPDVLAPQGGRSCPVDDPDERCMLMPSFVPPSGYRVVFDPDAGVIAADRALEFARAGAVSAGATLSFGERVLQWNQSAVGCTVVTDRRTITSGQIVLAVGGWVAGLVPELAHLFEVWRIVTVTLRPGQAVAAAPALGVFTVDLPTGLVFGIPDLGQNGFKVGIDAGPVWDPRQPVTAPTSEEVATVCNAMAVHVPGVITEHEIGEASACLYTMTADRRFVLGPLPWAPRAILAAPCSGHGFKFGPAIGEAVADWATGASRPDLDFVSVDRHTPR